MAVKQPVRLLCSEVPDRSSLDSWLGSVPLGSHLPVCVDQQKALAVHVVCEINSSYVSGKPHRGPGLG